MAQDAKQEQSAAPAPKSNKGLIIIIGLLIALLVGGGVFFMMQQKQGATGASPTQSKEKEVTPPVYVAFETFTVNLLPDPEERFLQLDLTMQVKSSELAEQLKTQMPSLRNRVLMLLTSKKASDIASPEGKVILSEDLLQELRKPLTEQGKPIEVNNVLFTSFVIQ